MKKRLIAAMVAVVAVALVLAGVGTLMLTRFSARSETERRVRSQVVDVASGLEAVARRPANSTSTDAAQVDGLTIFRRVLRLDNIEIVTVRPGGAIIGTLPPSVSAADIAPVMTTAKTVVSGHDRHRAFAAVSLTGRGKNLAVVVATATIDSGIGPAARWFGWAALVALLLAALVASIVAQRLADPLRAVEVTAHRIADGDLSARSPAPAPNAQDEIAQLTRSVNAMAESLQRSRAVEEQFLMSVSHDLRTPLTSISGYAEAIADGAAPDPAAAAVVIGTQAARLERLVRDLLQLAKFQSSTFSMNLAAIDVGAVVEGTARGLVPRARQHDLTLTIDSPPSMAVADGDRLGQVVANLIENAMKFARTTVWVSVRSDPGHAVIWVDDDGPGIAPSDLPHVFERLYVSKHQPERAESSSGLGLAIVAELIGKMHGQVIAQVAPSGGARMVVYLPTPR